MAHTCITTIGDQLAHLVANIGRSRSGKAQQARPTGSRVHANSPMYVGMEGDYWRPMPGRIARRLLEAAIRFEEGGRIGARRDRTGKKNGPLGHVGIDVLRAMIRRFLDYKTGVLFPSYETIAKRSGHCVAAVVAAMKRLARHGFLEWQRRIEPTGNEGLRGPQVRQSSNAYRLLVPAIVAGEVYAPAPEDDVWRRQEAAREHLRMDGQERAIIDALPPSQAAYAIMRVQPGEDRLADTFHRMGLSIEQRDSDKANESLTAL